MLGQQSKRNMPYAWLMTFHGLLTGLALGTVAATASCGDRPNAPARWEEIHIAAAANLAEVMGELTERFRAQTRIPTVVSLGSTASLAHQIENGAPFDVFLAADTEHIDRLVEQEILTPESRRIYALGMLVVWSASHSIEVPEDLASPRIEVIAVPKPEVAPYGRAAVEALKSLDLWPLIAPRVVYAQNAAMAKQFAQSGNADAALTAGSLDAADGLGKTPVVLPIASHLHQPLHQALGIVKASPRRASAEAFAAFLLSGEMQAWLAARGYRAAPLSESVKN